MDDRYQRDEREASEVKHEVERVLDTTVQQLIDDMFGRGRTFLSVGKTMTASLANLIAPGSGTVATLVSTLRERRAAKKNRWQGFLLRPRDEATVRPAPLFADQRGLGRA
jgi:hypothetical protein